MLSVGDVVLTFQTAAKEVEGRKLRHDLSIARIDRRRVLPGKGRPQTSGRFLPRLLPLIQGHT